MSNPLIKRPTTPSRKSRKLRAKLLMRQAIDYRGNRQGKAGGRLSSRDGEGSRQGCAGQSHPTGSAWPRGKYWIRRSRRRRKCWTRRGTWRGTRRNSRASQAMRQPHRILPHPAGRLWRTLQVPSPLWIWPVADLHSSRRYDRSRGRRCTHSGDNEKGGRS